MTTSISDEAAHTLVLGAGPAGLTAAYQLSRAGVSPVVVLEKEKVAGGYLRSIRHGEFIMDVGRKELYSRIPEVDGLWKELLGSDYRPYPHRFGVLYNGEIIEFSSAYRGFRRGMTWPLFLSCGVDLLWSWAKHGRSPPLTYEEYWYRMCGRRFSRIFAQGFWEKFRGIRWSAMPPPEQLKGADLGVIPTVGRMLNFGFSKQGSRPDWRHPAKGSGQICELLEREVRKSGGYFRFNAQVTELAVSGRCISAVICQVGPERLIYRPAHVVASLPIEFLGQLLFEPARLGMDKADARQGDARRSTILVYLFLDEEPRFPHAWLEVTDPTLKAGRITNYAAFNTDMVPKGKTCLCVEFFCYASDDLFGLGVDELVKLALDECARSNLIEPNGCFDHFLLKLAGADASTSWREWQDEARSRLLTEIQGFENLYFVNRPGADHASHAGLEAANAILCGDRTKFDELTSPAAQHAAFATHRRAVDVLRSRL
ncbi:MAG: FAD-dependent oxidoreductase [Egibacteraceae bacterium]